MIDIMSEKQKKEFLRILYSEKLKFCGCGTPGRVMRLLRIYLKSRDYFHKSSEDNFNTAYKIYCKTENKIGKDVFMLLSYICDSVQLTEHGGSVCSCWPTEYGYYAIDALSIIKDDLSTWE